MSRIIAIDYGSRRTGIAVCDPLRVSVNPLGTFAPNEAIIFLQQYLAREAVEIIVVGNPMRMDGSPSQTAAGAEQFAMRLHKMFPSTKIERYDERYTSKMAMQAMLHGGASRRQRHNKTLIDQISACIILQSYIDFLKNTLINNGT